MKINKITSNRYYLASILGLCAMLALGSYLLASWLVYRVGFPLDDSWIHQTYARNFAANGTWAFLPNQPSAGSTAPGWSLLLAGGHWLNLGPYIWTYFLGWVLLWGLALVAVSGFKGLAPRHVGLAVWAGLLIIFEWHLTWAAGSGMETLLSALIALVALLWTIRLVELIVQENKFPGWSWFGLGALIGFSVWVRPDGITLIAVVGLALILTKGKISNKIRAALLLGAGLILIGVPYLVFNLALAGEIWPNTFYAKQAEYAILRDLPLVRRYLNMIQQPITGVGIILLPGFLRFGIQSYRRREWAKFSGVLWVIGYLGIYAWRLPVAYQHGRYIMPVIPAYCLFGLVGMLSLLDMNLDFSSWRIIRRAWIIIAGIVLTSFWFLGLRAYAMDVAVIESEMVDVSNWVSENTEEDALVAAHDIGALGYYANRDLIDLAGLVSPEVIPFIRDEGRLKSHLNARGADYLVTFPDWYPQLVRDLKLIYQTKGLYSPRMDGENMGVFEWRIP